MFGGFFYSLQIGNIFPDLEIQKLLSVYCELKIDKIEHPGKISDSGKRRSGKGSKC
jgi:hypothetical protein